MSNKRTYLKRLFTKEASIGAGILVVSIVLIELTGSLEAGSLQSLTRARSQLASASSQLNATRNTLDTLDMAEKRYVDIQLQRAQEDFVPDNELMRDRLIGLKNKYRLGDDLKLVLSAETIPNISQFSALNDQVIVREKMELSFSAMSDLHAMSFLDDFRRTMPGIVRLLSFSMKRTQDMNVEVLSQMTSGKIPKVVAVNITFLWATLKPKEEGADHAG